MHPTCNSTCSRPCPSPRVVYIPSPHRNQFDDNKIEEEDDDEIETEEDFKKYYTEYKVTHIDHKPMFKLMSALLVGIFIFMLMLHLYEVRKRNKS